MHLGDDQFNLKSGKVLNYAINFSLPFFVIEKSPGALSIGLFLLKLLSENLAPSSSKTTMLGGENDYDYKLITLTLNVKHAIF